MNFGHINLEKLGVITSLQQEGSRKSYGPPYGDALGKYWHEILRKKLNKEKIEEEADDILDAQLIDKLKEQFNITLLEPEFQLYGYEYNKTETAPKVYFWQVHADAIGWHHKENKYVIVSRSIWKVPTPVLGLRKASSAAYETYLSATHPVGANIK